VYYFVITPDGSQYGPADVDTLVRWAKEGRIVASTILSERGADRQLQADSLTALAAVFNRMSPGQPAVVIERGPQSPSDVQAADAFGDETRPPPPPPPPATPAPLQYANQRIVGPKSKVVAGLLGIFLGAFGIHRFYLGYTGIGLLMLLLSIPGSACPTVPGAGCGLVGLWGFIEGVVCLCGGMRDADGLELRD